MSAPQTTVAHVSPTSSEASDTSVTQETGLFTILLGLDPILLSTDDAPDLEHRDSRRVKWNRSNYLKP